MDRRVFEKDTREMKRLYTREELSLRQIAKRFNISFQAVHLRLLRAGFTFRPTGTSGKPIDRRLLKVLHIEKGLPVSKIAKQLKVATKRVRSEMKRCGIDRKTIPSANRKYPQLDRLEVGESVQLPMLTGTATPYAVIYSAAQVRGIRLSVKTVGAKLEVTRKA